MIITPNTIGPGLAWYDFFVLVDSVHSKKHGCDVPAGCIKKYYENTQDPISWYELDDPVRLGLIVDYYRDELGLTLNHNPNYGYESVELDDGLYTWYLLQYEGKT